MNKGQRFGRLVAIRKSPSKFKGSLRWLFLCDCGQEYIGFTSKVYGGKVKSCGCLRSEMVRNRRKKHGYSEHPLYQSWMNMIRRCEDVKDKAYHNYGGRGIKVCESWKNIENFIADMGQRQTGLSLERINNDGDYSPENCKWATKSEQNKNRRPFKRRFFGRNMPA